VRVGRRAKLTRAIGERMWGTGWDSPRRAHRVRTARRTATVALRLPVYMERVAYMLGDRLSEALARVKGATR
jgi:hypothetical protein